MKLKLLALFFIVPLSGLAYDKTGGYETIGIGSAICSEIESYIKVADPIKSELGDWLAGYLTAYNLLTEDTNSISGNVGIDNHIIWLKKYCKAYPNKTISTATQALTLNLYLVRYKEAPKGI